MLQADICYTRTPGIVQRELDGSLFLVDAQSETVFYLNELGSAIWQMVAEPVTEEDVIETVHQAFPDVSLQQVTEDVSGILRKMLSRSLIVSATTKKIYPHFPSMLRSDPNRVAKSKTFGKAACHLFFSELVLSVSHSGVKQPCISCALSCQFKLSKR